MNDHVVVMVNDEQLTDVNQKYLYCSSRHYERIFFFGLQLT